MNKVKAFFEYIKIHIEEIAISISFILIIIHGIFNTYFLVDIISIYLLILLILIPYVPDILIRFKGAEILFNKKQGKTNQTLPPQSQKVGHPTNPNTIEKKILSTLYKYQKQSFGNDITYRWTFIITPYFKVEYPKYLSGVSQLLEKGLIAVSPENYHCQLTNEGLIYMKKNKNNRNIYDEKIVYTF